MSTLLAELPALVIAALVGLIVGSFLNVCIHRLPRKESVAWPGSHCPQCGHAIAWYDNMPVLSYLWLGGRCRHCRAGIPVRYLLVEIATAALFVAAVHLYPPGLLLASRLVFGCALIVLFVVDLDHRILPNVITVPGIAVGFVFAALSEPGWRSALIGIVAGGGIPLAIAWLYEKVRGHEGLGMGDVKMLAMIGAFLGWQHMLLTLVLSSFIGSIIGVAFIVAGKGARYALPFGTFLAVGALATIVVGDSFLSWYLSQF
jgi:leader peptidase (prepilin peptidase)/N-methyltransferase